MFPSWIFSVLFSAWKLFSQVPFPNQLKFWTSSTELSLKDSSFHMTSWQKDRSVVDKLFCFIFVTLLFWETTSTKKDVKGARHAQVVF
jgi:hypothetical protein